MEKGTLKIGRRATLAVSSIAQASAEYSRLRDESGEGASTFPNGSLLIDGKFYCISYNGKVWKNETWRTDSVPVFDPYAAVAA
jgi:hypothetical protein